MLWVLVPSCLLGGVLATWKILAPGPGPGPGNQPATEAHAVQSPLWLSAPLPPLPPPAHSSFAHGSLDGSVLCGPSSVQKVETIYCDIMKNATPATMHSATPAWRQRRQAPNEVSRPNREHPSAVPTMLKRRTASLTTAFQRWDAALWRSPRCGKACVFEAKARRATSHHNHHGVVAPALAELAVLHAVPRAQLCGGQFAILRGAALVVPLPELRGTHSIVGHGSKCARTGP